MVRTSFVLDSWMTIRRDAAQALTDMPADKLDFRPTPDLMTFREIAVHALNAGHALAGMLVDGVADMTAPDFRERMKGYFIEGAESMPPAELAERMISTLEQDCQALQSKPDAWRAEHVTRFDGARLTRLEMVQFTKEHELTHRSQMFVYLRLNGVVPPTTRRRMAKK
ncbi:MAG: DinB family protein [Bryobacteraceae bacterium]